MYQQWTLSKISWHLTVSKISNTWVKNNLDNLVSRYIRLWLEIPINGTLCVITQSKRKFGLGLILPSTRHTQCQVTFRNKIGNSSNDNIREIHKSTAAVNVQYDQFNNTREALKEIRLIDERHLLNNLTTQSLVIKSIWNYADSNFICKWSNVVNHLPKNIYSFVVRYLNNTLANATNAVKWGIANDSTCRFCDRQQTLGHVIGGCQHALDELRYNWRHNSILLHIYKTVTSQGLQAYVDIDGYPNPSIITGEAQRPDFILVKDDKLLVLELTAGFETNIESNFNRKNRRYERLLSDLSRRYRVFYINMSLGAIGVFGKNSLFVSKMKTFDLNDETINFVIKRSINVCIRSSYYIFCMRNKEWSNPELLHW